jgi:RpiR family carbohydrate utilization transcriptional regulator
MTAVALAEFPASTSSVASFAELAEVHRDALRPTEQRVVEHLLGIDPTAPSTTAGAIANMLGVSQATVVNTVQRLGYAGFGDFRRRLIAERAVEQARRPETSAADGSPAMAICRRVFEEDRRTLEATERLLDSHTFEQAVELIAEAPQVLCVGNGWSAVLARQAAGTLTKYGVRALAEELAIEQVAQVDVADARTVVFAISHRGRMQELLDVVARAKQRGMTVVALTNRPTSPLARMADLVLFSAGLVLDDDRHPNQSSGPVAHLTMVRALAEAIAGRNEHSTP